MQRNMLRQTHLKSTKFARAATSKKEIDKFRRAVDMFRRYGGQYDLDYLIMAALGYQEARLNQGARSPVGAVGVTRIMPATDKDLTGSDVRRLEPNIHAGVIYIRFIMGQYFADESMTDLNKMSRKAASSLPQHLTFPQHMPGLADPVSKLAQALPKLLASSTPRLDTA